MSARERQSACPAHLYCVHGWPYGHLHIRQLPNGTPSRWWPEKSWLVAGSSGPASDNWMTSPSSKAPAYEAQSGLIASRLRLTASQRPSRDWRVFGFGRLDNVAGAANAGSPLASRTTGFGVGVGIQSTWIRSDRSPSDSDSPSLARPSGFGGAGIPCASRPGRAKRRSGERADSRRVVIPLVLRWLLKQVSSSEYLRPVPRISH